MKIPKWLAKISAVNAMCDLCEYKEKIDILNMTEEGVDNLIGKKCPRCGHTMINENDLRKMKTMFKNFHLDTNDKRGPNFSYRTKKH